MMLWGATTVETEVSTKQVTLNESFVYAVIVVAENSKNAPKVTGPDFPENLPFSILRKDPPRPSHKSQATIINGQVSSINQYTITLLYQLKPKSEGQLQIPALEVKVNGKSYHTKPVTITVSKENTAVGNSAQLKAAFSSEKAMLGDVVTLTYDIFLPRQLNARIQGFQWPEEYLDKHFTLKDIHENPQDRIINGIPYATNHIELQLIPKHTGTITLPPAVMSFVVPDRQQRTLPRGFPGGFIDEDLFDSFGMFASYRPLDISCEETTLEILPLPEEGKPADFTGIVGKLRVKASLSTSEATVGEPLLLDLALSGAPNLVEAKLPDLTKNPELARHFKVSGDDPALEKDGQVVFQRTLRATHPGDLAVPALHFSYYDPEAREYREATTKPISIKVASAKQITLGDAQGATPVTVALQPADTEVAARNTGLEPDFPPEELTHTQLSVISSPRIFLAPFLCLAIPPVLWACCAIGVLLARHRNANGAERAARGAKGLLLRTVGHLRNDDKQAGVKFFAALQAFFTARFQLPPGAVTYADAEAAALRHGFAPDQIKPFQELFAVCEAAQFAGGNFDLETAKTRLKTAIKEF